MLLINIWGLGIGDWGLGIGDWAQSPIPNPLPYSLYKFLFIYKHTTLILIKYIFSQFLFKYSPKLNYFPKPKYCPKPRPYLYNL